MWIEKICRLCGQISENVTSIFHNDDKKIHFELKLGKCLSISITEQDLKPKEICEDCLKKINDFYNFILICEATDFEFDKILYESSSKWYQTKQPTNITETIYESTPILNSTPPSTGTLLFDTAEYYQTEQSSTNTLTAHKESSDTSTHTTEQSTTPSNYYQTVIEILKPVVPVDNKVTNEISNNVRMRNDMQNVKAKPFACSVCNKQFMRRANVQIHMSNQHSTVRPFQCKTCEKQFSTKRELRVHNLLHTEQYRCTYCGHVFPARGKLERHIRTHTGERPYVCIKCDKAFSDKRNLDAHIHVLHNDKNLPLTSTKPYECTKCDKSFRSKSHLNEHFRVHTVDMPFICDTCGKRFKWRANLILHMHAHSGIFYQCTICKQKYTRSTKLKKHTERCHSNITNLDTQTEPSVSV